MRPTASRGADRPAIGHKPGRQKISTIGSAAPGRRRPATVAPLPACPRTAALRLELRPSSGVSSFSYVLQRAHLPAFHSHFLAAHNTGSPFTFVLQCAHLPAFHGHFLTAHNTGTPFTFVLQRAHLPAFHSCTQYRHRVSQKNSLNPIFFCLSHCTQCRHRVSQKNSLNHIFFCLSHHGTVSRARFPVPDNDGFKLFTSLVHCASHSTSSSIQIQERLER